jgi:hypothetical protein
VSGFGENIGDKAAAVAIIGYIAAVLYQENPDVLAKELANDARFLEFVVALYALYLLWRAPGIGPIARPLILLGVASAALVFVNRSNVIDAIRAWNSGSASMFETLLKMAGVETPNKGN